jgi:nucleoside-diphosphate-sugar epimerase
MTPARQPAWRPARAVVTGGAGFLGSHLCERLLQEDATVICLDSFLTGTRDNIESLLNRQGFSLIDVDVAASFDVAGPIDAVLHLATPASPRDYLSHPIQTLRAGGLGTMNALELAERTGARFLLASSSEVYGDPLVHPQIEDYHGNVDPVGPRSVYDEAKRFGEAATAAYAREHGLETRIARIFNTYGPRMRPNDGRMIPAFVMQALQREPLTIHGDGSQTRSLCYVSDLVEGLWRLLLSDVKDPVNLGGEDERTVFDVAGVVAKVAGVEPVFRFVDRPTDDPQVRRPDITRARTLLDWEPKVDLWAGLDQTISWFRTQLEAESR